MLEYFKSGLVHVMKNISQVYRHLQPWQGFRNDIEIGIFETSLYSLMKFNFALVL